MALLQAQHFSIIYGSSIIEDPLLSEALFSIFFMKITIRTYTIRRLASKRRATDRVNLFLVLTVIAIVIHQDDFFDEMGWAFLKYTEKMQKDESSQSFRGYHLGQTILLSYS